MSIHVTHYRYDRRVALSTQVVRLRLALHCRTPILGCSPGIEPSSASRSSAALDACDVSVEHPMSVKQTHELLRVMPPSSDGERPAILALGPEKCRLAQGLTTSPADGASTAPMPGVAAAHQLDAPICTRRR